MSNNRKTYSFKSVGQTQTDFDAQQINVERITPVGIVTPVSFAATGGSMFDMTLNVKDQIRDNLKNLLLTNRGERMMLTDFGANLRELATELSVEDVAEEATRRISKAVGKYMPFIELDGFESKTQPSSNGSNVGIVVRVTYSVPSIGATNQAVEAIIYVVG